MRAGMRVRPSSLARIVSIVALVGLIEAKAAPSPKADVNPTVAAEAIKDVKYDPAAPVGTKPETTIPVPSVNLEPVENAEPKPSEPEALALSPYIVRDLPDRTYEKVNEAISQQRRLERYAFYKKDLTKTVRME